jgi:hypothetical protein
LRKPTTLIAGKFGSRHFGTKPYLAEAMSLTGKDTPLALYVGAASGDDRNFGTALSQLIEAAGAKRVLWPKVTGPRRAPARLRDALGEADLVFVGGGDVEAGIATLRDAGLVGMSAGAIMLGERWIRWPHAEAGDDQAETYECLGIAGVSIDTHGEGDAWAETQAFAAVRARELGAKACAYGVPSGGALVVAADGVVRARGEPVPVFVAQPKRKATLKKTLEVAP